MKISYNWLKQFLNIDWDPNKTGELLTDLGLEVEGITAFETITGGLKGIVVGHVLNCEKHPNADKLKITTVDIGTTTPLQIVCGAPNVAEGQKVPVATIGTTLYTEDGEAWKIKKGKIRGEESYGMICAEDELGLGTNHDGIMILDQDLTPGTPCADVFEIENDFIFEIGLTPNRADAMSHFGVARDLRAGLIQQEIKKELITPPVTNFNVENRSLKITVDVKNNESAPRYCGLTISNIIVQESPDWLKNRLRSIGLTPLNNVVDVTNYVLHELGQPLHAFDANKIKGNKIEVKTIAEGTKFTTLDGVEREIHAEDLMICDEDKPLCIAGVYGGISSGVTENTTAIFLESAYFNPVSIRKTAKRHGINTDASFRFERGIDIQNVEFALRRAASLIREITGGDITSDIVDIYPKKVEDHEVFLTYEKINKLIGQNISGETIKSILTSLDIKVKNVSESGMGLAIPFYRIDVKRQVDVIEEILRVYGYNNINFSTKLNASIATTSKFEDYKLQNVIGNHLASQGFFEIMANSLTTIAYNNYSENIKDEHSVKIINPLSSDLSVLRQSMLFGGLEAISHNINRKKLNLKFFEFGKTYHQYSEEKKEDKHLSLFVTGQQEDANWLLKPNKSEFFYLKSSIENILSRLGIDKTTSAPLNNTIFQEGLSLKVGKQTIVDFGIVQSSITNDFDIKQEVLYADFNWETVIQLAAENAIVFKEISKYPTVKRDFALLLNNKTTFKELYDIAFETEKKLLKEVSLFDVFTGKNLAEGKKSYAVSFTLADENNTLKDKQIDKIMAKLRSNYETKLGAELR
ncbi:phenylalanine--tRNA ligase subunit beta [Cellulophaga sp. F20128]|uniref:phenylalanine--tRNA ligase subunit beta n=1 Tax=Cellulophaga sp. F20128 TaxID=2926413 RepID=UPI001FF33A41|nr:phenylalanine--tRNA ligase subunit beta [Cellulophaga sp. F20128]MCK0156614.1 phenylalanine--tRNA ligase subunit beta [Cellulophaga sp. F20128]